MSLKSRTEKNLDFLDYKIGKLEKELKTLKKVRFRMMGLLHFDDRYLKRLAEHAGLKVTFTKLHYKEMKDARSKS